MKFLVLASFVLASACGAAFAQTDNGTCSIAQGDKYWTCTGGSQKIASNACKATTGKEPSAGSCTGNSCTCTTSSTVARPGGLKSN